MKKLLIIVSLFIFSCSKSPVEMSKLVLDETDGLYYLNTNLDEPYSGPVDKINEYSFVEEVQGNLIDGKWDGPYRKFKGDQDLVVTNYDNGVINGSYISYFPKSRGKLEIQEKGFFINGVLDGEYISYYPKRYSSDPIVLKLKTVYRNGIPIGPYRSYHENGNLKEERSFKNELQDGITKKFSDKNQILSEETYKDGKLNGVSKFYFYKDPNGSFYSTGYKGKLSHEYTYKNGVKDGPFKKNYSNYQKRQEGNYSNGKLNGILKVYDGSNYELFNYVQGIKNGIYEYYYEYRGKDYLVKKGTYKNDLLNGEFTEYKLGGSTGRRVSKKYSYNDKGELNGPFVEYDRDGFLILDSNYLNGKLQGSYKTYYEGSKILSTSYIYENGLKNGPFVINHYKYVYDNIKKEYRDQFMIDNPKETGFYKNDLLDGPYKKYEMGRSKNYLQIDTTYRNGNLHGKYIHYTTTNFRNKDHIFIEKNYIDGILHGLFREYYQDDNDEGQTIKEELIYDMGVVVSSSID